jgi:hypothetical protein
MHIDRSVTSRSLGASSSLVRVAQLLLLQLADASVAAAASEFTRQQSQKGKEATENYSSLHAVLQLLWKFGSSPLVYRFCLSKNGGQFFFFFSLLIISSSQLSRQLTANPGENCMACNKSIKLQPLESLEEIKFAPTNYFHLIP